jgi:hypothetical protein
MVLFERVGDELRYQTGDDDSARTATPPCSSSCSRAASTWSGSGLYFSQGSGETAVMMW